MPGFVRRTFRWGRQALSLPSTPSSSASTALSHATGEQAGRQANVGETAIEFYPPPSGSFSQTTGQKQGWGVAWNTLDTSLRILRESSDAFPPLKSAVGFLIACIGTVQAAAANREDYESLASELRAMVEVLSQYSSGLGLSGQSDNVARILQSIEAEAFHIQQKQDHGRFRTVIEAPQNKDDVIRRYQRIKFLFRQLQADINLRTWDNTRKLRERTLLQELSPVHDARYNSSYATTINRRRCTAHTREKVQKDIQDWATNPKGHKVHWMNGMAGTGKSTIAYSLCEWLENEKRLGGNFCCSRLSNSCNKAESIISTVAYQLAQYSSAFQAVLCHVLEESPDASKRDITWQFQKLIVEPLRKVRDAMEEGVVVVIDALDECLDTAAIGSFLDTALKHAENLPVKFFLTSRPEPLIQDKFRGSKFLDSVLQLHDIEESIVAGDIKAYLTEELSFMDPLPLPSEIQQLADRSGKLFIYAATAVRYILPPDGLSVDPTHRLQTVLHSAADSSKQYDELNALYSGIMSAALNNPKLERKEIENRRCVLWTSICAMEPITTRTLASLLRLSERDVSFSIRPLQSLLHTQKESGLVSALHASFPDYMLDETRSNEFYCDKVRHNELLASACFSVMKTELRFNICRLESSFLLDEEVPDLTQRVERDISSSLSYSCQYWGVHLQQGTNTPGMYAELVDFLTNRVLFWMEVLNLQKNMKMGEGILERARVWLLEQQMEARKLLADAMTFVVRYTAGACNLSTPHIYISNLPFTPKSSSIYAHHWKHSHGLLGVDDHGAVVEESVAVPRGVWHMVFNVFSVAFSPDGTSIAVGLSDIIQVLDAQTGRSISVPFAGHEGPIRSVAFSSDAFFIASGSDDKTARLWDVQTGLPIRIFTDHQGPVNSVAISCDGTRVASGSDDRSIRVWDVRTGQSVVGPLMGHDDFVLSVVFSGDGTRIASGSRDKTLRVWDTQSGQCIAGPFVGHKSRVNSIAFSSDGNLIVSGSHDQTIRVWDVQTSQTVVGPFIGHEGVVNSVDISCDASRIVSGSNDNTVRVWDAKTGQLVAEPFIGHVYFVNCVAFSRDGTRIASGANDRSVRVWNVPFERSSTGSFVRQGRVPDGAVKSVVFSPSGTRVISALAHTIRVWDALTGQPTAGPFTGHTGMVNSVAISSDGRWIASGSNDRSVNIWDAQTAQSLSGSSMRHTERVTSVAFSGNGTWVASGSTDRSVRMWNAQTHQPIGAPLIGHTDVVNSVSISPNSTRIASGSDDKTIHIWDTQSRRLIFPPLIGHKDSVLSVAFSGDGSFIASGSLDKTVRIWNAENGEMIAGPFVGHEDLIYSVAISGDCTRVVSGSRDETVRVWDVRTGLQVAGPFIGHEQAVTSVAFSPDGTTIVSGSVDNTIRIWDASYVAETVTAPPPFYLGALAHDFPPDSAFSLQSDGWVSYGDVRLLWIPVDLRLHMPYPSNTLVIGPRGSIVINYQQHLAIGERWAECYVSK